LVFPPSVSEEVYAKVMARLNPLCVTPVAGAGFSHRHFLFVTVSKKGGYAGFCFLLSPQIPATFYPGLSALILQTFL
jgi:hypothetical protein